MLLALDERGATSQAELGGRLRLDPSDLHAVLNDLEGKGFVRRVRDDADRRRKLIELTGPGADALDALDDRVRSAQDALLALLSNDERRVLQRLLTALHRHHSTGPAAV